jgi:hypothetical protein
MTIFATFAYIGAVIAFVVIFLTESHKSTTETLIMTTDNSGQDGYTCTMISKVSAAYSIVSDDGFGSVSQAFQLINVIESRLEYQVDYAIADPCSKPLEFFAGNREILYKASDVTYGGVSLYMEQLAFIAMSNVGATVLKINYTSGHFATFAITADMSIYSIAVDVDSNAMFIATESSGAYGVYRLDTFLDQIATEVLLYNVSLPYEPIILNDNLYNIYLAENTTFTALDVYSDSTTGTAAATNTTLFSTRAGEYITHAAVYNSGDGIVKVYYINNTQDATVWENGIFTELGQHTGCVGITVDGSDNHYYLYSDGNSILSTDISLNLLCSPKPFSLSRDDGRCKRGNFSYLHDLSRIRLRGCSEQR